MVVLDERQRAEIRHILQRQLVRPVRLHMFTQTLECMYCQPTEELVRTLAELDDRIQTTIYNFQLDRDVVQTYNIDKVPAILILDDQGHDPGIRFFGIPSGFEFESLLHAISLVSRGQSRLPAHVQAQVRSIDTPLHIQVFVTPTCPYCPAMVQLAHELACIHPQIRGDMVEAIEFPHLAQRYMVRGVPKTVVNDVWEIEGMVPEEVFVAQLIQWYRQQTVSSETVR